MGNRKSINFRQEEEEEILREKNEDIALMEEVRDRIKGICGGYIGKKLKQAELDRMGSHMETFFQEVFKEPRIRITVSIVNGRIVFNPENEVTNNIILRIYGGSDVKSSDNPRK